MAYVILHNGTLWSCDSWPGSPAVALFLSASGTSRVLFSLPEGLARPDCPPDICLLLLSLQRPAVDLITPSWATGFHLSPFLRSLYHDLWLVYPPILMALPCLIRMEALEGHISR